MTLDDGTCGMWNCGDFCGLGIDMNIFWDNGNMVKTKKVVYGYAVTDTSLFPDGSQTKAFYAKDGSAIEATNTDWSIHDGEPEYPC